MPDLVRSLPVDIKYKQSSYGFHGRYEFVEPYCGCPGRFHTNGDRGWLTFRFIGTASYSIGTPPLRSGLRSEPRPLGSGIPAC